MESLRDTFEMLKETKLTDGQKNIKAFQDFIQSCSEQTEINTLVVELAEYSQSAHLANTFKHKDLKKSIIKRCVLKPILASIK